MSSVSQWEIDEVANGTRQNPVYGIRSGGPVAAELALALTADDITRLGIEYVIGGTHWPMYVPFEREAIIRDYHRQNIFLLTHPLTNIIAHPWWWMGHWQNPETKMYTAEPWFDDFNVIPTSMHDEFIAAARQYGKIVEVNNNAMLTSNSYPEKFKQQYCEFLAAVKGAGVPLSFGSDHHSQHQIYTESACRGGSKSFISSAARLAAVGITDADFWRLPPRKV